MCLVVAVWDQKTGIIVSEGRRSRRTAVGAIVPVADDVFKVHRLSTDVILGMTGETDVIAELRAAITADAGTYPYLRDVVIPREMVRVVAKYPRACISVTLMGLHDEKVAACGWGSRMPDPSQSVTPDLDGKVGTLVAGFGSMQYEANTLVSQSFADASLPSVEDSHNTLASIFRTLAKKHDGMNSNLKFEVIAAPTLEDVGSGLILTAGPNFPAQPVADPVLHATAPVGAGALGWTPISTGTPTTINFGNVVSGSAALPSGVNSSYIFLKATGYLVPTVTGLYTIGVNASDGVNLYIGNQTIIANLSGTDTANSTLAYKRSGTIYLSAGVYYPINIEWQHAAGTNYELQLIWTPPLSSAALIPTTHLTTSSASLSGTLASAWWNGTSGLWYPAGPGIIDFASPQVNKTVDNIADGTTYHRTTVNQVTGAGRAYSALDTNNQVASQLNAKPLYAIQTFSAGNPLSQSGTTKTITVAASTINWGTNAVNYSSGSVTPLVFGTFFVYADDPTFAGGAVTYHSTISQLVVYQNDGRVNFGSITTASGGGGVGGGGSCFSPNTKIKTQRGDVSFWDIQEGDLALTARGTWRSIVLVRCSQQTDRPMLDMGNGELVTLGHLFKTERWTPATELGIFAASADYTGFVANLCIEAEADDDGSAADTEHSYTLANGFIVHNMPQGTN